VEREASSAETEDPVLPRETEARWPASESPPAGSAAAMADRLAPLFFLCRSQLMISCVRKIGQAGENNSFIFLQQGIALDSRSKLY
jgi:hypothetical protein